VDTFLFTLDLIGTFVFALSGATLGVRYKLDLFGVLVLAVAASTAGGIVRDVLIGAVPPAAMNDWRYFGVAFVAGMLTFFQDRAIERLRNPVMLFDAVGLGLCAATGANKALDHGLAPGFAVFLGMLSGIGGGIARDVLVARIPATYGGLAPASPQATIDIQLPVIRLHKSGLQTECSRLAPGGNVQFAEDVLDVRLHRLFGKGKFRGNLRVAVSANDPSQHVQLANGQVGSAAGAVDLVAYRGGKIAGAA